jgi:hypothetical protein
MSFLFLFDTLPHYVAQVGLELTMRPWLASNLRSSYLHLLSARITSMLHLACILFFFKIILAYSSAFAFSI